MLRLIVLLQFIFLLAACGKMQSSNSSSRPAVDPFSLYANALQLAAKNSEDLYFGDGRTVTYIWTMDTEEVTPDNARFPGEFKLDVKVNYQTVDNVKVATGYSFTNPRLQLFTGEMQVEVEAIVLKINGIKAQGIEPFLSARKTARGSDPTNIYSGSFQFARHHRHGHQNGIKRRKTTEPWPQRHFDRHRSKGRDHTAARAVCRRQRGRSHQRTRILLGDEECEHQAENRSCPRDLFIIRPTDSTYQPIQPDRRFEWLASMRGHEKRGFNFRGKRRCESFRRRRIA